MSKSMQMRNGEMISSRLGRQETQVTRSCGPSVGAWHFRFTAKWGTVSQQPLLIPLMPARTSINSSFLKTLFKYSSGARHLCFLLG